MTINVALKCLDRQQEADVLAAVYPLHEGLQRVEQLAVSEDLNERRSPWSHRGDRDSAVVIELELGVEDIARRGLGVHAESVRIRGVGLKAVEPRFNAVHFWRARRCPLDYEF